MKKRLNIIFSGMVQGVGFRFTAEYIARNLGAVGWVKNLRDGKVEMVAEGEESTLKTLLARLNEEMGRYIRDTQEDWQDSTGEFSSFDIAF